MYHYRNEKYCLALEYLAKHEYDRSRFLDRDVRIEENKIPLIEQSETETVALTYINSKQQRFYVLEKVLSFGDQQQAVYEWPLPLIIIGSAGSGKTALSLEKMKQAVGDVLYVTQSSYLAQNSRKLYYAHDYKNDHQNIEFLFFHEFLETIQVPEGREISTREFARWVARHSQQNKLRDAHKLFEEFRGIITGSSPVSAYLTRADYLALGIKQSIFSDEDRPRVYDMFEKYLGFLRENSFYDPNLLSHA